MFPIAPPSLRIRPGPNPVPPRYPRATSVPWPEMMKLPEKERSLITPRRQASAYLTPLPIHAESVLAARTENTFPSSLSPPSPPAFASGNLSFPAC